MIEDGKARLLVADDGAGLSKEPRKGPASLGTSLVRTLARQLKGRVFVDGEGGTKTQIDFDLARLLRAASQRTEEVVLS
jgi:two-component sensor histidine kinase